MDTILKLVIYVLILYFVARVIAPFIGNFLVSLFGVFGIEIFIAIILFFGMYLAVLLWGK